jgi:HSP20 family protein
MSFGTLIPLSRVRGTAWPLRDADRLFDEFWGGSRAPLVSERVASFVPHMDVVESDDEYRVTAELPGLEEKDFELVLEDDVLTLKGEKRNSHESQTGAYRRAESVYGKFERRLRFSTPIDAEHVKAQYKNGVLSVTLPKPEEARPQLRTIPVETR